MPTALITGAPDWVPAVAIALKSEGFEILSPGEDMPLAPGSVDCVVLVGEEPLRSLLEMLADALATEASGVQAKVVGAFRLPAEIAALARPNSRHRTWRSYLDEDPDLGFAEWRDEVLCLTSSLS